MYAGTAKPVSRTSSPFKDGYDPRTPFSVLAFPRLPRRNSHRDRVFLAVVNKGNSRSALDNAIDGHACPAVVARLPDGDMVDGFPVPIVHRERIPLRGQARLEAQRVCFLAQPQQ